MKFWVATTDSDGFRFLSTRAFDEVNFWQPSVSPPFRTADVGLPFLFKLIFGEKNGTESIRDLRQQLTSLRHAPADPLHSIGCQIITSPIFLSREHWLADPPGWSPNIVRGRMYDTDDVDGAAIWSSVGKYLSRRTSTLLNEPHAIGFAPGILEVESEKYGAEAFRTRIAGLTTSEMDC